MTLRETYAKLEALEKCKSYLVASLRLIDSDIDACRHHIMMENKAVEMAKEKPLDKIEFLHLANYQPDY